MRRDDAKNIHPILFLDDWPLPPNSSDGRTTTCPGEEDYLGKGMNQMRKWRIQTLLAVNSWGIPVMAFKEAYERMYPGKPFDPKDHGYENIGAMVYDLTDIFAVQEPDDVTALMFPDYQHDRILHDARLGHEFAATVNNAPASAGNLYGREAAAAKDGLEQLVADPCGQLQLPSRGDSLLECAIEGQQQLANSRWSSSNVDGCSIATTNNDHDNNTPNGGPRGLASKTIDPDTLISYAWIHRDTDFPPDVVLAGEQYNELILPLTSANIPGARGVHQAKIVGVANPHSFYINVKSSDTPRNEQLTSEIYQFFMQCAPNIDQYNVPEEFIYPGFPCLVYSREFKCWERCVVVNCSRRTNRVLVEYVDFGGTINVNRIYLYLMPRQFFDLPKQAILCSLIGLRPKGNDDKWSRNISCRMRSFSQPRYWLDVLLVEPKVAATNSAVAAAIGGNKSAVGSIAAESASLSSSVSAATIDTQTSGEQSDQAQPPLRQQGKPKRKKRVLQKKLDFEAIICDRHDEHGMNLFLEDILVMETYGDFDTDRAVEYNSFKDLFKKALATLPRPKNPFKVEGSNRFWPKLSTSGVKIAPPTIDINMDDQETD